MNSANKKTKLIVAGFLILFVAVALLSAYNESANSSFTETSIELLDGNSLKLSDYSGKVLVVDLWATWCGPCRQEIPLLIELAKEYKSKGVEVIGLTIEDPVSDERVVSEFTREFNINYPIGWANPTVELGLKNGREGIPQTIIIGRDGKVKRHFVGFNLNISPPQMKEALDKALAEG